MCSLILPALLQILSVQATRQYYGKLDTLFHCVYQEHPGTTAVNVAQVFVLLFESGANWIWSWGKVTKVTPHIFMKRGAD
jgi:hypothetical protein